MTKSPPYRHSDAEAKGLKHTSKVETSKKYESNVIEYARYVKFRLEAVQGADKQIVDVSEYR